MEPEKIEAKLKEVKVDALSQNKVRSRKPRVPPNRGVKDCVCRCTCPCHKLSGEASKNVEHNKVKVEKKVRKKSNKAPSTTQLAQREAFKTYVARAKKLHANNPD